MAEWCDVREQELAQLRPVILDFSSRVMDGEEHPETDLELAALDIADRIFGGDVAKGGAAVAEAYGEVMRDLIRELTGGETSAAS